MRSGAIRFYKDQTYLIPLGCRMQFDVLAASGRASEIIKTVFEEYRHKINIGETFIIVSPLPSVMRAFNKAERIRNDGNDPKGVSDEKLQILRDAMDKVNSYASRILENDSKENQS